MALDTSIWIYWMEEKPEFLPIVEPIFEEIDRGRLEAVTSAVTLLEVLVLPLRNRDTALAEAYEQRLLHGEGLTLVPLDTAALKTAAEIRAFTGTKTPDSLQLAAALQQRCSAFVTNDRRLPSFPGLRVLDLTGYRSA